MFNKCKSENKSGINLDLHDPVVDEKSSLLANSAGELEHSLHKRTEILDPFDHEKYMI